MTESDLKLVDGKFYHLIVEGSDYEIGTQLAEYVKERPDGVSAKEVYTSANLDPATKGFEDISDLISHLGEYAPGIAEELQGFADGLDSSPGKIPFLTWTFMTPSKGHCSQLAALSSVTDKQHVYAARTYEWTTEEDLVLCTTRRKGKARHIGFTSSLHGRYDGFNEHGLLISMTGGGIFNVPINASGFFCCVAIREALESCRDVSEGLDLLRAFPLGGHFNLILADKKDRAALVEFADGDMEIRETSAEDPEPYVYSVNHYKLPKIEKHNALNCGIIAHSKMRQELITKMFEDKAPQISRSDIQNLFATLHPNGLCNHFYDDGFGTLWSMIFDLTECSVDVCFSAPTHNEYRRFELDGTPGFTEYPVIFPKAPWT
ncbi:MAG: hypothetical protein JSW61_08040 [Candidatus Thorarchaeota archaeon]|nr:MAG: hypothetical protein JSW61_08040 [Candidatus Thorarchaeota archaeon]